ncbi:hypothetical protein Bbelb_378790 [Branchiostoma belcheri]|nr:hypothetical protein Bbelb_378790 [Branchiostoma belcheri]
MSGKLLSNDGCAHTRHLSKFVAHLGKDDLTRYSEKCAMLGTCDPYLFPLSAMIGVMQSDCELPNIAFPDIYMYLISHPSLYTGKAMKAYKSLDAYKYFTSVTHVLRDDELNHGYVMHHHSLHGLMPYVEAVEDARVLDDKMEFIEEEIEQLENDLAYAMLRSRTEPYTS